jgi:hypothetical protein
MEKVLSERPKYKGRPYLSWGERLRRLVYFVILAGVSFLLLTIFDTDWVAIPLLLLVGGYGISEINGMSALPFLRRYIKWI